MVLVVYTLSFVVNTYEARTHTYSALLCSLCSLCLLTHLLTVAGANLAALTPHPHAPLPRRGRHGGRPRHLPFSPTPNPHSYLYPHPYPYP